MAGKPTLRCREISKITDKMTDEAIDLYEAGEMSRFWAAIESLSLLQEVKVGVCDIE